MTCAGAAQAAKIRLATTIKIIVSQKGLFFFMLSSFYNYDWVGSILSFEAISPPAEMPAGADDPSLFMNLRLDMPPFPCCIICFGCISSFSALASRTSRLSNLCQWFHASLPPQFFDHISHFAHRARRKLWQPVSL